MDHHMHNYVETVKVKSCKANLNSRKIQSIWSRWTAEHKCFKMKHYYKGV